MNESTFVRQQDPSPKKCFTWNIYAPYPPQIPRRGAGNNKVIGRNSDSTTYDPTYDPLQPAFYIAFFNIIIGVIGVIGLFIFSKEEKGIVHFLG